MSLHGERIPRRNVMGIVKILTAIVSDGEPGPSDENVKLEGNECD